MVLNYIWIAFFVIAFVVAVCKLLFFGDTQIFTEIINSTFDSSKTAFEISLGLTGVLSLWLGVMKIGENSGLINALSRWLSPVFCRLFPDIPKGHPVMGSIFMNMSANMLGLDNAATPMGLKAMKELQELNPKKDTASNPMIMFLVINTSGLIIIPISIMVYRAQMGAAQPTDIFIPILLSTFISTLVGVIAVQANGSSVGHFHYTPTSLPVLKAHFSSVQCGSSPHIQLPLLVRELLYGITQHSAGHHFAIFIQKLQQQGLVPLSHFTQHPAYSLPHQVMFVLQQQFRKTENIDEIVIPDEGNRRYDSNTLIPQQSTFRQPIKIITRLIL